MNDNYDIKVRRLTQKECWRLFDFDDADYENARKAINEKYFNGGDRSGTQLYKQAGNSIVINTAQALLKKVLEAGIL